MTARSITMTAADIEQIDRDVRGSAFVDGCSVRECFALSRMAIAIEAERRLLAKLAAVPVERLSRATVSTTTARGAAEAVRAELLRAVKEEPK